MGILQRVMSMTKAAANEMLDKIENPVTMLNHYLRDLDEEIARTEHALARQQVEERVLQSKLQELSKQIGYYEEKAVEAASGDREAEARLALEAKLLYSEQAEETSRLQQLASQAVDEMKINVENMKEERTRLQSKRTELIARVRQNPGSHGHSAAHSLNGSTALRGFERIEQKVMEWEAEREIARSNYNSSPYSTASEPLGFNQQQEQRNARVEEELKRLLDKKPGS